ncbi:MAG: hypothetical protein ABIP94_22270, partial [Planctomycetota bacterium]
MSQPTTTKRRSLARFVHADKVAATSTAVATFGLAMLVLRHGLAFGPDAWTYWSASVSLLEGRGYVDAHGLAVQHWPPLYSLWLAAVQSLCGVSVASVRLADALCAAAFAGLSCAWLLRRTACVDGARWPVALFATNGALLALRGGSSEYLMLALLGVLLLAIEAWRRTPAGARGASAVATASVAAAAMVGVRHAALAFVPAAGVMIVCARTASWRDRAVAASCIAVAAAVSWWGTHLALAQQGSFPLGSSDRELWATVWAMAKGIDRELAPFPLGIGLCIAIAAVLALIPLRVRTAKALGTTEVSLRHGDVTAFVLTALAALLAMFLLVQVADSPGGRFVRFASLMLGGLAVGIVRGLPGPRRRCALLLLLLLPNTVHAAKVTILGRSGRNTVSADGGEAWLPMNATLCTGVEPGTVLPDGRIVVAVPVFVWQQQRLDAG